jgi:hypothetical protein
VALHVKSAKSDRSDLNVSIFSDVWTEGDSISPIITIPKLYIVFSMSLTWQIGCAVACAALCVGPSTFSKLRFLFPQFKNL